MMLPERTHEPEASAFLSVNQCLRVLLRALPRGPFDSGGVCFMGPDCGNGIYLVCIGVQIHGQYYGPIGQPLTLEEASKFQSTRLGCFQKQGLV